jgi:hypothetical protein
MSSSDCDYAPTFIDLFLTAGDHIRILRENTRVPTDIGKWTRTSCRIVHEWKYNHSWPEMAEF